MKLRLILILFVLVFFKLSDGKTSSKITTSTTKTTSSKIVQITTTTLKHIQSQNCPIYTVNSKPCVDNGDVFTMTTGDDGCRRPICAYPQTTITTTTLQLQSLFKIDKCGIPYCLHSQTTTSTTKTTSSRVVPITTITFKRVQTQNCPIYTVNYISCVNGRGVLTMTTGTDGCGRPTCCL
ncbi:hypothetical protein PIROE2DRAFT_5551 [Piromyces sp. E2]|nr:hypothetical protein PIROE2DRAFT_5551 [Piromyces sp. E2]|eukprot:OUM67062.1 hypothetical protein PIROE2DRAFT_5551 [Piromyces sp. E2]